MKRLLTGWMVVMLAFLGPWEGAEAFVSLEEEMIQPSPLVVPTLIGPVAPAILEAAAPVHAAPAAPAVMEPAQSNLQHQLEASILQWGTRFIEQNVEAIGTGNLKRAHNGLQEVVPAVADFIAKYTQELPVFSLRDRDLIAEFVLDKSSAGAKFAAEVCITVVKEGLLWVDLPSVKSRLTLRVWDSQQECWKDWRRSAQLNTQDLLASADNFLGEKALRNKQNFL